MGIIILSQSKLAIKEYNSQTQDQSNKYQQIRRKQFNNSITKQQNDKLMKQLQQWEQSLKVKTIFQKQEQDNDLDPQKYFTKNNQLTKEQKIKFAQIQKNKGNQSIKSKDFDQAIKYYTKSLQYDPKLSASYCNRALAYLKKKQYHKCIEDCTRALQLNSKYTKAFHRRAKAYKQLKNNVQAYKNLKQGLLIQPDNNELNGELKQLRSQLTQQELQKIDGKSITNISEPIKQFKRIQIQEQDDD